MARAFNLIWKEVTHDEIDREILHIFSDLSGIACHVLLDLVSAHFSNSNNETM